MGYNYRSDPIYLTLLEYIGWTPKKIKEEKVDNIKILNEYLTSQGCYSVNGCQIEQLILEETSAKGKSAAKVYQFTPQNSDKKVLVPKKFNKIIEGLKCKNKEESLCKSDNNCLWINKKKDDVKGKCIKKWKWFTGANIFQCDECDLASVYCTLNLTSRNGFIGLSILCIIIFTGLIQLELTEEDKENIPETNLRKILLVTGWLLWFVLMVAVYFFFMLWIACPDGSDMGNVGRDDRGFFDQFRMGWQLIKFWFVTKPQDPMIWNNPKFIVLVIFLIIIFGLALGMSIKNI